MLKDKAIENLEAGELLLERGRVNAAASRYYDAMYQAAVHGLNGLRIRPAAIRSGAVEWDHSMVENNTRMLRGQPLDRLLYMEMRRMRGQADYGDETVDAARLAERRDAIRGFVKEVAK